MSDKDKRGRSLCANCASQIPEMLKSFRERSPLGGSFTHDCGRCGFLTVAVGQDGRAWVGLQVGNRFLWGGYINEQGEIEQ